MPEPSIEELNVFFPGTGSPDPAILLELAPLIPDHLLPRAIQVALGIRYPALELRARTVERLASRLKPQDEAMLEETLAASRAVFLRTELEVEPALLYALAPLLPPYLLPQALEQAIHIVKYNTRIDVLASLAERLSRADQKAVMHSALKALQTISIEGMRAGVLKTLIKHLPRSLFGRAMAIAGSLQDVPSKLDVLIAMGERLRGKTRMACLSEVLNLIRSIKDAQLRARFLVETAPILFREQSSEAVEIARGLHDTLARVEALAALAPFLPGAEKRSVLAEALATANRLRKKDARLRALASLSPLLSGKERLGVLLTITALVHELREEEKAQSLPRGVVDLGRERWDSWGYAEARAVGLGRLAERVPEKEGASILREAVTDALSIQDEWSLSYVLTELAPILPEQLLRETRETERKVRVARRRAMLASAVQELPENPYNVQYVAEMMGRLSDEERAPLLRRALKKARSVPGRSWQAISLTAFAGLLPEEERADVIAEITDLVSSAESPVERAFRSLDLLPLLPESQKAQMIPGLLDLARAAGDEYDRAGILDRLIPLLKDNEMYQVLEIAQSFQELHLRIELLQKMALSLHHSEMRASFAEALAALESVRDERERSHRLRELAPFLPSMLLESALDLARGIRRRTLQADAVSAVLASLARQAYGLEREEIVREALKESFFTSPPSGGRGGRSEPGGAATGGERARNLLQALPEAERDAVLKGWLGRVERVSEETGHQGILMAGPPSRAKEETGEGEKAAAPLRQARERVVNTGFSNRERAEQSLDREMPLATSHGYYFWLEVGELDRYSIEMIPTPVPVEHLPSEAVLRVALFSFENEIEVTTGEDVGELTLLPDGTAEVTRQPVSQADMLPADMVKRRLFFPVATPASPGVARLRCNIYYEQILIQARLVQAQVMEQPQPVPGALSSALDYSLSHTLWPAHLNRLDSHRLSLMLNANGDRTHALIFGQKGDTLFKNEAVLSASELKRPIENVRKALWKVSWGTPDPWSGQQYRYKDQKLDQGQLAEDLVSLAIGGYILYDAFIDKLTGGRKKSDQLAGMMLSPGLVQVALKQSPTHVLPAALFYDYPLDTQARHHKLCGAFASSLRGNEPLGKTACFNGACPSHGKLDHVCPSGFWGYRHFLGMPLSVGDAQDGEKGKDVPPEILVKEKAEIVTGVATNLDRLDEHMQKLRALRSNLDWYYSERREEILALLKERKAHIIYFYCHGVLGANKALYLQVGSGADYIEGSNLRANRIFWDDPCPLVFINGCQTTAVDPEQAINLVQDFVGSGGAGVIGTEITVFEPLACGFAEECLRLFLSGDSSIGEAIRNARLKLLREGNPLGLVYTPFVIPSLRLKG